jgi:glycosyltransferase involved in cell wall biosynthesis
LSNRLVSVITPLFNAEGYILDTLASIAQSTYPNIELIVIDDGSTDLSAAVAADFLLDCGRPYTFLSKKNSGEAETDNFALGHASGEYIVIVNADDPIFPSLIEESARILDNQPSTVVAYPDWQMINWRGDVIRTIRTRDYSKELLFGDIICVPGPGAMIRKSAIGQEPLRDPRYRFTTDYVQWLNLALKGEFVRIPKVLANWRTHESQQSQVMKGLLLADEIQRGVDDFFARADLDDSIRALKRQALSMARYHAATQSLYGKRVPGRRLAFHSLITPFRRVQGAGHSRRDPRVFILIALNPFGRLFVSWWNKTQTSKGLIRHGSAL